jgi:hypothetical protein
MDTLHNTERNTTKKKITKKQQQFTGKTIDKGIIMPQIGLYIQL